jgi:hypothetical protein
MEAGEISGNTASSSSSSDVYGGGVYVGSGTFTMSGGEISGNTASSSYAAYGGGVFVGSGTFTMSGGEISGNTASSSYAAYGGGVFVNSYTDTNFLKKGGTIYGDTDTITGNGYETDNTATSGNGHAVYTGNKQRNVTAGPGVKLYAKYTNSTWTYDGTGVDGINADTTANWDQ